MRKISLLLPIALGAIVAIQTASAQTAAEIYKGKCSMCHGSDGTGNTPAGKAMKARDLHEAELVKASDKDLEEMIKKGKGKMPAYGEKLTEEQIDGLVAKIRTLQKSAK